MECNCHPTLSIQKIPMHANDRKMWFQRHPRARERGKDAGPSVRGCMSRASHRELERPERGAGGVTHSVLRQTPCCTRTALERTRRGRTAQPRSRRMSRHRSERRLVKMHKHEQGGGRHRR
eukprot:6193759-Pleurochrysis_carterae.AAC.2